MAGESSSDEATLEALSAELESAAFGMGLSHMAVLPDTCQRCRGSKRVGSGRLKVICPDCSEAPSWPA